MKSFNLLLLVSAFGLSLASVGNALAHEGEHPTPVSAEAGAAVADDMTEGEIKKIDLANGKVTLKHGDIKNLEMPSMTMVFQVKDKTSLTGLQVGNKVQFKAVSEAGKIVITEIHQVK